MRTVAVSLFLFTGRLRHTEPSCLRMCAQTLPNLARKRISFGFDFIAWVGDCSDVSHADSILDYTEEHLIGDPEYVTRLQWHYAQFKTTLRRTPERGAGFDWRRRARSGGGR